MIISSLSFREALIALNMAPNVGSMRLKKLLDLFGSPQNILLASQIELRAASGIGEKIAAGIRAVTNEQVDREIAEAQKKGIKLITLADDDYPAILKKIPDPPLVLYVKGCIRDDDALGIGIVGSRRSSLYGLQCAQEFARRLAAHGFTIVSGMARGIDTNAHRGALDVNGRTIAVMGSGFNRMYPPENAAFAGTIASSGAVITEFPMDRPPLPQNFPCRNRIISGLSIGILVVEAARNSGALITADCALEQGREVFALPGKVDCETSQGTNDLIKQGAALVSSPEDILEELGEVGRLMSGSAPQSPRRQREQAGSAVARGCTDPLLDHIAGEPVSIDTLVEKTGMDISQISAILIKLQIQRVIKPLPGKAFIRINHEEKRPSYS